MAKFLVYIFSRQFLHDCAAFFTVGAFLLAGYAVVYPAAVSEYLDEIARNTEIGNAALQQIQGTSEQTSINTGEISENTGALARAIAEALLVQVSRDRSVSCLDGCEYYDISIGNITTFRFSEVELILLDDARGTIRKFELGSLYPEDWADYRLRTFNKINSICIKYKDIMSQKLLFDHRISSGFSSQNTLRFDGGSFGEVTDVSNCFST